MTNALSVDLEDWFCVANMQSHFSREDWPRQESRIVSDTNRLLELFDQKGVSATFFVLGWVADHHPDLVREIARRGHEIASHGYSHRLLTEMTREEFTNDLEKALSATSRCTDERILGFRAPSFTVTRTTVWALDILADHGFRYDSSIFPVGFHPDYGIKEAPLTIHRVNGSLLEFPLTVAEILGRRIPCSGGAYFRIFPYAVTKSLLQRVNGNGRPFVFYVHPWEIDEGQPRVPLPASKRLRHYTNLAKTYARLERLLSDFEFSSLRKVLGL